MLSAPYAGAVGARELIVEAIRDHGPIRFDRYMELALYGDGGFYGAPPVGAAGDFMTSPHVHPVFGELLGRAISDLHALLGAPDPFRIAEVGAGDGTLARQLLVDLASLPLTYVAVERSAGARDALSRIDGLEVAERLGDSPHLVLANELLDNLPFRRFRGTGSGTAEVMVGLDGDRLVEHLEPRAEGPSLAEGDEGIEPEGAFDFVDDLAARLAHPGYALLIDYGGVGEPGGPAHGYRGHRLVEDPLDQPGSADITAGVDFQAIAERAERDGLVAFPSVTQRHALTALGFDRWIKEELRRQAQHLDERRGLDAVRTWSGRSAATILVDPAALGRLRWLLLGRLGVPTPAWT
jgi:NADH dehydrogenase [ubiquinone] 1 alpha subcomplex assembly factor 7